MHLHSYSFNRIKSGEKKVEIRVNDIKRRCVSVGDQIQFSSLEDESEVLCCEVLKIEIFSTFAEAYKIYPEERDLEVMHYYTAKDVEKFGVVVFEIKKIDCSSSD